MRIYFCIPSKQHGTSRINYLAYYHTAHVKMRNTEHSTLLIYRGHFLGIIHERRNGREGGIWGVVREFKSDRDDIIEIVELCALSNHI